MTFKYVMFKHGIIEIPIIFPEAVPHICIVEAIAAQKDYATAKPVSAGFIDFDLQACYGESTSTGLKSRPIDKKMIDLYPYCHGIANKETMGYVEKLLGELDNG